MGRHAQASEDLCRPGGELRHPDGPPAFDRDRDRGRPRLRLLRHRTRDTRRLSVADTIMTASRRRIAVVTGSRADYGLLRGILTRLQKMDDIALGVIACGMHLLPKFGETWRLIEADGFPIAAKIDLELSDDRAETVARGTGIGVAGFAEVLPKLAPDLIVVLGDRFEILSAAVAATLLNIPIAHIHGGEITGRAFADA